MTKQNTPAHSLREQFKDAVSRDAASKKRERQIEKDLDGAAQDFAARLAMIAASFRADLEAFIQDIKDGNTDIHAAADAYKHKGAPLKFEITIPSSYKGSQEGIFYLPGYEKIHKTCAGKDVDMDIRVSFRSAGFLAQSGEIIPYKSLVLEIYPHQAFQPQHPRRKQKAAPNPASASA